MLTVETTETHPPGARALNILLVEDDRHDIRLFRLALERAKLACEITECQRAEDALELLVPSDGEPTDVEFDLVVADHQLPGMNGLEFFDELSRRGARPCALALLTGAGSEDVAITALKSGVHEYITKDNRGYLEMLPVALPEAVRRFREQVARQEAEEALRLSEARLRQVIDLVPHKIYARDAEGRFLLANEAVASSLGTTVEEVVGGDLRDLHAVPEEVERMLSDDREVLDRGEGKNLREVVTDHGGEARPHDTVKLPFVASGDDGPAVVGISIDITEAQRAEEERRQLQARILQSQKMESLATLAGGVAHELNNALMGILGNASLALMDLGDDAPMREVIVPIEEAAQRAADLAEKLRAFAGGGMPTIDPIDPSELVRETVRLQQVSLPACVVIELDVAPGSSAVEADAGQLQQVVTNLVANAVEALGDDGGTIEVSTGVTHCDRDTLDEATLGVDLPVGEYVYIEVADNGRGMDAATREHIFDPFFTSNFTGRGLGLAAVLGIVRTHRGAIRSSSQVGEGATFRVFLPAADPSILGTSREVPGIEDGWRGQGTVLVVDDELVVRDVARRILERVGFEVLLAANGQEAKALAEDEDQALVAVILDAQMPLMDGFETLEVLRNARPDVPVIMASGYSEHRGVESSDSLGPASNLRKPYSALQLMAAMKQVLET